MILKILLNSLNCGKIYHKFKEFYFALIFYKKGDIFLKLIDYVNKFNEKKVIRTQRLMEMKKYYVSMYRVHMVRMYDKGYISDPTRLDKREIFSNIEELGIKSMFTVSGVIELTSRMAMYSYYKNYNNEEAREFLDILYNILRYREYIKDVDQLYDSCGFASCTKLPLSIGLRLKGARVVSKTEYGISRAIISCFQDSTHTTDEYCFNDDLWDLAMKELGIPEEDWEEDGLFDKDLSHAQEIDFMDLLLDGVVPASGKYKQLLEDWMYQHKWTNHGFTVSSNGLFEYLFSAKANEIFVISTKLLSSLFQEEKKVLGMSGSKFWVEREIVSYNIPMSTICVVSGEEDSIMFDGGVLNGYTGEVYPVEYVQAEGIHCIGCPVELYVSPKEKGLFFDLEEMDVKADSWFKLNIQNLDFCSQDEVIPRPKKAVFKPDSLEEQLYQMYEDSLRGKLVGELSTLNGLEAAKKAVMKAIG